MRRKTSRLYIIFNSMHCRCERKQTHGYERYGGRGITVCDEWKHFAPFEAWALTHGYADDLTIDRIDNDKGYSPNNCRWVTKEEQVSNMRTNRYLTFNGETKTVAQWSRETGLSRSVITKRLNKGLPAHEIFLPKTNLEKPLIAIDPKTEETLYFNSGKEAERQGHSRAGIWRAMNGEYKTHHGYIWKYAD